METGGFPAPIKSSELKLNSKFGNLLQLKKMEKNWKHP